MKRLAARAAILAGLAAPALAQTEVSGFVAYELRGFPQAPAFPGQSDARFTGSASAQIRLSHDFPNGTDRVVVTPYLRFGGTNGDGRDHADLREAYWFHRGDGWNLTAGIDKVFWGVTESRHLVDIVNQTDWREDIDGEDKLGQPMVALTLNGGWGTLGLYALVGFRDVAFPTWGSRLGGPAPLLTPTYDSGAGPGQVDFAARWSRAFGDWDVALSWFNGTSREPVLTPAPGGLVPHYNLISQAGLEAQYTTGDWLWKLEAIRRSGQGPTFWAATGGFEWTLYGVAGTGADLGLIAEYNHDGRDPALAPPTIYDEDMFLGTRLSLSDISDTSILAGALLSTGNDSATYILEAQRRLGENWLLSVDGRWFTGSDPADPAFAYRSDDFVSVTIERNF